MAHTFPQGLHERSTTLPSEKSNIWNLKKKEAKKSPNLKSNWKATLKKKSNKTENTVCPKKKVTSGTLAQHETHIQPGGLCGTLLGHQWMWASRPPGDLSSAHTHNHPEPVTHADTLTLKKKPAQSFKKSQNYIKSQHLVLRTHTHKSVAQHLRGKIYNPKKHLIFLA